MSAKAKAQSPRAIALSLVRVSITGVSMTAVKAGVKYFPPVSLLTFRFIIATFLLWAINRVVGGAWPNKRTAWTRAIIFSIIQVLIPTLLLYLAMPYSSAGTASIVYATQPLVLALVATRLLGEKLTLRRAIGMILGFGGVVFVMYIRIGAGGKVDTIWGTILNGIAVISLTGAAIFFKRYPVQASDWSLLAIQYAVSSIVLIPTIFLFGENPLSGTLNGSVWGSLAYSLIGSSIIGPLIFQVMLAKGEASVFMSYYFLTPCLGLLAGTVFLGEGFTPRDSIGLALTAIGITIIARSPAGVAPPKPATTRG